VRTFSITTLVGSPKKKEEVLKAGCIRYDAETYLRKI